MPTELDTLEHILSAAAKARKQSRIEALRRRPTKRPDWNELMKEIEGVRSGQIKLKKIVSNDRSQPVLGKVNFKQGQFMFESENNNSDILKEITTGIKLRHVKTNDRSKPNLKGIRNFRRQLTKEEELMEAEEGEDFDKIRDDLESTKQLLELEIRSKALLEKDNKRMQSELERMRNELMRLQAGAGGTGSEPNKDMSPAETAQWTARKNSIVSKRQSMIRLLSEGEGTTPVTALSPPPMPQTEESEDNVEEEAEEHEHTEIEEMREEVDEARRLAEEWELKYKEMQRQMSELEGGFAAKKPSAGGLPEVAYPASAATAAYQRTTSTTSDADGDVKANDYHDADQDDGWMQRREIRTLESKLRNTKDKKEVVVRERKLLNERIDALVKGIENEMLARKRLRKEIRDMNDAFRREICDMLADERTAAELEECYFSDDDLVPNTTRREEPEDDLNEDDDFEMEEEEVEETLDDIIKAAEGDDEEDPGRDLFESYHPGADCSDAEDEELEQETESRISVLQEKIRKHHDQVQTMRRSNFLMKSKIDRLYDILQMQKEKHHDLRQELTRTLSDFQ